MTRISRIPVSNEVLTKLYTLMFEVIGNLDEEERFFEIFDELLSNTEKIMIAKRIAIIYLLMKKVEFMYIADVLKVSSSTIAKFQKTMKEGKAIRNALKSLVNNEKIVNFFEKILLEIRGPGTYGVNWESAWKHKIDFEKRKRRGF